MNRLIAGVGICVILTGSVSPTTALPLASNGSAVKQLVRETTIAVHWHGHRGGGGWGYHRGWGGGWGWGVGLGALALGLAAGAYPYYGYGPGYYGGPYYGPLCRATYLGGGCYRKSSCRVYCY